MEFILDYINLFALIATLFGIAYAIRVNQRVRLTAEICTKNLISDKKLEISVKGKKCKQLSLSTIVFKNDGNRPIYQHQLLDSCIRIIPNKANDRNTHIVQYSFTKSRNEIIVSVSSDIEGISIVMDRMFPGDDITFNIYHSGLNNNSLIFEGEIKGQKKLYRYDYLTMLSSSTFPFSIMNFMQSLYWAICVNFVFLLLGIPTLIYDYVQKITISHYVINILMFVFALFIALFTSSINKWLRFNQRNNIEL